MNELLDLIESVANYGRSLWRIGNRREVRWAITAIFVWPMLLFVIAMLPWNKLVVLTLGFVPVVAVFGIVANWPMLVAAAAPFADGRRLLRWILTVVGSEILVSIYLWFFHVENDRMLVPVFLLILFAISFFKMGAEGTWSRRILNVFYVLVLAFTAIFALGGRTSAVQKAKAVWQWSEGRPAAQPVDTLGCGNENYINLPVKGSVVFVVKPAVTTGDSEAVPPDTAAETEEYEEGAEGCWTDWLLKPYAAQVFWIEPKGIVDMEKKYADGSNNLLLDFDPTREVVDKKKLTGVRFRNVGEKPVLVRILLQ